MSYIAEKLNEINNEVKKCNECFEYVEPFSNFSAVSFGTTPDLLIVGESPTKNGWIVSGVAWHDSENRITPSGKRMQKLLDQFNINLMETYFTEAIKCYPVNKKHLDFCSQHCKKFLNAQIEVLNPNIVLLLGDYATRTALDLNNFNEIVGLYVKKTINEKKILFIPIYSPSSIYFKRNFEILEEIKQNDSFALNRTL